MERTDRQREVTYTPESLIRRPGELARDMWRDLMAARELAWRLTVRDISAKYRQSVLGILWAFIPPILASAVFIFLHSKKVVNLGDVGMPYPVFALIGTTLWQLFVESINAPLKVVTEAKPMLAKINFPREALIMSAFYQSLFALLIKALLIVAVLVYFDISLTWQVLVAVVPAILLIWVGITVGLLLTPLGVLYTDVSASVMIFTQFLFFVTPVVYAPPTTFPYSLVTVINPVSPFLMATRELLVLGTVSNLTVLGVTTALLVAVLLMGWIIYRLAMPILIERMSA